MKVSKDRKMQIGIIGSAADLQYSNEVEEFARLIGVEVAKSGNSLVFGAEKDCDSLPTVAAVAARQAGGITIGVTYEKGLEIFNADSATIVVPTGTVRGGGRELTLILSCDVVIAIAGGSGTLNELCVAYQADIPVIIVDKFGGWSERLANKCLDERQRYQYKTANSPERAVQQALSLVEW